MIHRAILNKINFQKTEAESIWSILLLRNPLIFEKETINFTALNQSCLLVNTNLNIKKYSNCF